MAALVLDRVKSIGIVAEQDRAPAHAEPGGAQYMNVNWIGPTLMRYGTPAQQARYHLARAALDRAVSVLKDRGDFVREGVRAEAAQVAALRATRSVPKVPRRASLPSWPSAAWRNSWWSTCPKR